MKNVNQAAQSLAVIAAFEMAARFQGMPFIKADPISSPFPATLYRTKKFTGNKAQKRSGNRVKRKKG